jgi:NTP pyrophosphatase (non-canonical NTP hydrolase)
MISDELRERILRFRSEREWERFHTPRNLAIAISVEAAELLEHFQWQCPGPDDRSLPDDLAGCAEELADLLIPISYLTHDLRLDVEDIVGRKLEANGRKYPAEIVRGSAKRHTSYR